MRWAEKEQLLLTLYGLLAELQVAGFRLPCSLRDGQPETCNLKLEGAAAGARNG
jgi:hypothetical protein